MYTYSVSNNDRNTKIANAIQATFTNIRVKYEHKKIVFETPSDVTIVSIRAAYKDGER